MLGGSESNERNRQRSVQFIASGQKMSDARLPGNDPATIARIPGVLDALFPQLTSGVVVSLNHRATAVAGCEAVPQEVIAESKLQRSMLFELSVAVAEGMIDGSDGVNWDACLNVAVRRQRDHFDAVLPEQLSEVDKSVALRVARNLVTMLDYVGAGAGGDRIRRAPGIAGYQWIAPGVGDFAVAGSLIEVKCTNRRFVSADYRQMLIYWLLSYAAAIESGKAEWIYGILINPRLNLLVQFLFDDLINLVGAGRSKVELLEMLGVVAGDRWAQL